MKRALALLVLSAALFIGLSACTLPSGNSISAFTPATVFSAKLSADKGEFHFEANVKASSYSDIVLEFTAPENLAQFTVKATPEGFVIDAYGIEDAIPYENIGDASALRLLMDSIRTFIYTNHGAFTKGENDTVKAVLTVDSHEITAVFDKNGLLTSLIAPDIELKAAFTATEITA